MHSRLMFERGGVRLAALDFGGDGPPAVLLHGLAGHGGEWAETASWLTMRCRVIAPDARGHGRSERSPADVSPAAHVADTVHLVEQLGLGRVVVVGQSLGGRTALLLAAQRPDLVRGLIVAEASPAGGGDPASLEADVADVEARLRRWPVPFASREAAIDFFAATRAGPEAWAAGLEERDGGLWPCFEVEVMARTLREAFGDPLWEAWDAISCPALVVRAEHGMSLSDARAMQARGRSVTLVDVAGAEHDVHLDRPDEWREAVSSFVDALR